MTRLMEKELTHMLTVHITTVNGLMISSMEKVWNLGQMVPSMKENTSTARKKAKENLLLLMAVFTKENSNLMKYVDLDSIHGQMENNMKVSGLIIKCMVKEL